MATAGNSDAPGRFTSMAVGPRRWSGRRLGVYHPARRDEIQEVPTASRADPRPAALRRSAARAMPPPG